MANVMMNTPGKRSTAPGLRAQNDLFSDCSIEERDRLKITEKTLKLLTALAGLFFGFKAFAIGTFIPATNRVDMVYDDARSLLYISSGGDVLRYDLTSDSFLTPFHVGFSLLGMDLSPDGNTLAVADAVSGGGSNWVHLIDLPTGVTSEACFAIGFLETGTC